MATISSSYNFNTGEKKLPWQTIIALVLAFWLSCCILLDLVIIPSLFMSGVMSEGTFAPMGNIIFSLFNRIELIAAAFVLTGLCVMWKTAETNIKTNINSTILISAGFLLAIALTDTYIFTPQLSALGANLDLFTNKSTMCVGMTQMHIAFWVLETTKLFIAGFLLKWSLDQR
jgi:hypothetical protein